MVFVMDRSDPAQREAMDQAARAAEWILDRSNDQAAQELALDVLAAFVDGIDHYLYGNAKDPLGDPLRRLAWALVLTERRDDLRAHEQRLLDHAWDRVRELQLQREWQEMGDEK
jgi:hypothetical protein